MGHHESEGARIFISHSAKESYAQEALDLLESVLATNGFEVLLDRKRLQPGSAWRPELHGWMRRCHGAVVLFSEAALKSDWVLQAATILNFRRYGDDRVLLVPVFLPPVEQRHLQQNSFHAVALDEVQAIARVFSAEVAQTIAARFAPLKDL